MKQSSSDILSWVTHPWNLPPLRLVFSLWWSWVWRSTLLGVLIFGFIGGLSGATLWWYYEPEEIVLYSSIVAFPVNFAISIWTLRRALRSNHRRFYPRIPIVDVAAEDTSDARYRPPTYAR